MPPNRNRWFSSPRRRLPLALLVLAGLIAGPPRLAAQDRDRGPDPDRQAGGEGAWLGVELRDLDEALREAFDFEGPGVLVVRVVPGSPAAAAGLERGDIITRVGGDEVRSPEEVSRRIRDRAPGDRLSIERLRRGKRQRSEIDLGTTPERLERRVRFRPPDRRSGGFLGVRIEALGPDLAGYFEVETGQGVLVTAVDEDGPAAAAGLKAGDVVTRVGDEKVGSPRDLQRVVGDQEPGSPVDLTVVRRGKERKIQVTLARAPGMSGMRRFAELREDLDPLLDDLRGRLADGRDALEERVEKLEEVLKDLERQVDELVRGDRRD